VSGRSWAIGACGVVTATAAILAAAVLPDRADPANTAGATPSPAPTAQLKRQNLVVDDEQDGTLGYGGSYQVIGLTAGVLTWLPVVGQTIGQGQRVYEVNGVPVTLWHGRKPFWRLLRSGMDKGADVRELEQNLKDLGYFSGTPDETFARSTATAVKKWQKGLGLERTGVVDPGAVVVLPSNIRVTTLNGAPGGPAQGKLIEVSGSTRLITVKMPVTKVAEAPLGSQVKILLPDGAHTTGKIGSVGTVATAPPDSSSDGAASKTPTVDVLITPNDPKAIGKLDGAPVTVAFTSQHRDNVLAVPIEALLALSEGGYAVETVDGNLIKVDLGLFANGKVEVSGAGLQDGMNIKVAGE
jgi:peptidoglycan hydrolase-like protein with peptidoglycan-binding domain